MSIVARWRRWWGLSRTDRSALLGMMLALPLLSAALRFFGYARVRRWIEDATNRNVRPACASDPAMEGERLARLAAIAGRHGPIRATCLRQSLLIYGLLRERGLSPELKIGVKGGDGLPDMHAWWISKALHWENQPSHTRRSNYTTRCGPRSISPFHDPTADADPPRHAPFAGNSSRGFRSATAPRLAATRCKSLVRDTSPKRRISHAFSAIGGFHRARQRRSGMLPSPWNR